MKAETMSENWMQFTLFGRYPEFNVLKMKQI